MSSGDEVTLAVEPIDAPDVWALIVALRDDLNERYAEFGPADPEADAEYLSEVSARDVTPPTGAFVVARIDGVAVACGALRARDVDGVGELKRMYVVPEARGRGLSRLVLARLEAEAAALGFRRLVLDTGVRQPEAIHLYETSGWTPIEGFGQWQGNAIARFFGKEL